MNKVRIPVIYYHSIGPKIQNWVRHHLTLELKYFEDQLKRVSKEFTAISLKDYWEAKNGIKKVPQNAIVLTIDDGYLDNWVWAFPYLKKYNLKATIFVSPEFVDTKSKIRPIADIEKPIDDQIERLKESGYLSWEEMIEMEESGLVDIQSHTMSHTKYFISDKLKSFNHPGADVLYPVGNHFADRKPYYITDEQFDQQLPYGYPFFEESSAVIARRVWINEDFNKECIALLSDHNWARKDSIQRAKQKVAGIYKNYRDKNNLIVRKETNSEYEQRVAYEIVDSKKIIEEKLNKKVAFLCWPHGDNNLYAHQTAMNAGYLATTLGKYQGEYNDKERIDARIGTDALRNNIFLTTNRMLFNVNVYRQKFPYRQIKSLYYKAKK